MYNPSYYFAAKQNDDVIGDHSKPGGIEIKNFPEGLDIEKKRGARRKLSSGTLDFDNRPGIKDRVV